MDNSLQDIIIKIQAEKDISKAREYLEEAIRACQLIDDKPMIRLLERLVMEIDDAQHDICLDDMFNNEG